MRPDAVVRMLERHGETMVLKRAGLADLSVRAKRGSLSTDAIAGSLDDADQPIRISNAEIAATPAPHVLPWGAAPLGAPEVPGLAAAAARAPRQGDTIGGYRIVSVDTRKVGETVALHILTVAGGHS